MPELSRARAIAILLIVGLGYITWGLLVALQPPFYPSEAEKKGARPSQYGFVYGIYNLAAFITAPFFGRYGSQIGPKLLYNTGAIGKALAGLSFGFLDYIADTATFLGLSYALRFIGGIAGAAALGSIISILMKLFPNHTASVLSWTEMLFGLGYMLGPAVGSALYDAGGFILPFLSLGSVDLAIAIFLLFIIPNVRPDPRDKGDGGKPLTFGGLAKNPLISLPFVDNFFCACGNGMVESMLEPHLKSAAGADQMQVGITFLILGGFYMITTPAVGYICDRFKYPTVISLLGNIFMATAFLLIGPVYFIPFETSLALIQGSMAVMGLSFGLILVSTFGRSQRAAIRNGYNSDIDTYLIISGMWTSTFYLGNFVGPTIAGFIVENFGFKSTTLVFFGFYAFIILLDSCQLAYILKYIRAPQREGYSDLDDNRNVQPSEPAVAE